MNAADLEALVMLFRQAVELAVAAGECQIATEVGGLKVSVSIDRSAAPPAGNRAGTGQATRQVVTGEIADDIRRVLSAATEPIKLRTIASRCNREAHGYFRQVANRMWKCGELTYLSDGNRYWLASRPLPAGSEQAGSTAHQAGRET